MSIQKIALSVLMLSSTLFACATEPDEEDLASSTAAISQYDCPAGVPAALAPAADQHLSFVLHASGVQKYVCAASGTWTFVAPEADLMKQCGHLVGLHYAGPTWEYQDGSSVKGSKLAGATVDATAIPWLLLTVVSHDGADGKMTPVTSIQRLNTTAGLAPATGCDAAHVGATADIPYTADYFFYRTRSGNPAKNIRCGAL